MIKVYQLTMSGDCEGRSTHTIGYFREQEHARKVGKTGFGSQSMGPDEGQVNAISVYESVEDFVDAMHRAGYNGVDCLKPLVANPEDLLRRSALAKLTLEERKALGV